MKAKSPKSNLSGSVKGEATVTAALAPFAAKLDAMHVKQRKSEQSSPDNAELILRGSDNTPIPIKKSDVRLVESVESKHVTRIVLADGREVFVQETAHHIFEILQD
jgi:hypothetical protein